MLEIKFKKELSGFQTKYLEQVEKKEVLMLEVLHQLEIYCKELEEMLYLPYRNIRDIKGPTLWEGAAVMQVVEVMEAIVEVVQVNIYIREKNTILHLHLVD